MNYAFFTKENQYANAKMVSLKMHLLEDVVHLANVQQTMIALKTKFALKDLIASNLAKTFAKQYLAQLGLNALQKTM